MYVRSGMGQASLASTALGSGISAGVSLAEAGVSDWLQSIQLSHVADTATTQIVNGLAPKLQALKDSYLAGPGTCPDQAAAEAAYMTAVNWLMSPAGCGNGAYGSAGNRCISDRFGPGGPTDTNAKYPWASYYYAPIANDERAAGCAAELAASNPDAAEQAALQNIANATSGNSQQVTAGLYAGSGSSAGTAATSASSVLSSTLGPLPIWGWLAAGLLAVVALK